MFFLAVVFFAGFLSAQGSGNPNDLVCDNAAIRPELWQRRFPTNYAFNGFFRADGDLEFRNSAKQVLLKINLDNSLSGDNTMTPMVT